MVDRAAVDQQADLIVAMLNPVIRDARSKQRRQTAEQMLVDIEAEITLIRHDEEAGLTLSPQGWADRFLGIARVCAERAKRGSG